MCQNNVVVRETNLSGGWWVVSKFGQITGNICIELDERRYMFAQDNGRFVLGPSREGTHFYTCLDAS